MNPIVLFRKELSTEEEFNIASKYFDVVEFRSDVPPNSLVIGRYSCLPYFKELEYDLNKINSKLINSYQEHKFISNFEYYDLVKEYTFQTWFNAIELPDDGTQFIVKGRTNSRKFDFDTLMYAKNKAEAINIMWALNKDHLISQQGVIFRRYEPLVTYEVGINGLPFTNEWRFFFYKDNLLSYGYYWSIADNIKYNISKEGLELAQHVANMVKDHATFFVLDIAEKESGGWVLVEINDGMMSGNSCCDLERLYKNLKNVLV